MALPFVWERIHKGPPSSKRMGEESWLAPCLLLCPEAAGPQEPGQPIEIMRHENRVKSEKKRRALAEGLAPG